MAYNGPNLAMGDTITLLINMEHAKRNREEKEKQLIERSNEISLDWQKVHVGWYDLMCWTIIWPPIYKFGT